MYIWLHIRYVYLATLTICIFGYIYNIHIQYVYLATYTICIFGYIYNMYIWLHIQYVYLATYCQFKTISFFSIRGFMIKEYKISILCGVYYILTCLINQTKALISDNIRMYIPYTADLNLK